jgi:hypothetical protein
LESTKSPDRDAAPRRGDQGESPERRKDV